MINERIKYKVLSHIHISQSGERFNSLALFFHSLHIVLLGLLLLSPLVALLSLLVLKLQTDHSAPVLWNRWKTI